MALLANSGPPRELGRGTTNEDPQQEDFDDSTRRQPIATSEVSINISSEPGETVTDWASNDGVETAPGALRTTPDSLTDSEELPPPSRPPQSPPPPPPSPPQPVPIVDEIIDQPPEFEVPDTVDPNLTMPDPIPLPVPVIGGVLGDPGLVLTPPLDIDDALWKGKTSHDLTDWEEDSDDDAGTNTEGEDSDSDDGGDSVSSTVTNPAEGTLEPTSGATSSVPEKYPLTATKSTSDSGWRTRPTNVGEHIPAHSTYATAPLGYETTMGTYTRSNPAATFTPGVPGIPGGEFGTEPPYGADASGRMGTGAIVGIGISSFIVFGFLLGGLIFFRCSRSRRRVKDEEGIVQEKGGMRGGAAPLVHVSYNSPPTAPLGCSMAQIPSSTTLLPTTSPSGAGFSYSRTEPTTTRPLSTLSPRASATTAVRASYQSARSNSTRTMNSQLSNTTNDTVVRVKREYFNTVERLAKEGMYASETGMEVVDGFRCAPPNPFADGNRVGGDLYAGVGVGGLGAVDARGEGVLPMQRQRRSVVFADDVDVVDGFRGRSREGHGGNRNVTPPPDPFADPRMEENDEIAEGYVADGFLGVHGGGARDGGSRGTVLENPFNDNLHAIDEKSLRSFSRPDSDIIEGDFVLEGGANGVGNIHLFHLDSPSC